jgi:hypothetical protein
MRVSSRTTVQELHQLVAAAAGIRERSLHLNFQSRPLGTSTAVQFIETAIEF